MSDYNRNAANPFGAGAARAGSAVLDQGLRAYMLGVYNNMAIGLAITGLVAYGTNLMSVVNTYTCLTVATKNPICTTIMAEASAPIAGFCHH